MQQEVLSLALLTLAPLASSEIAPWLSLEPFSTSNNAGYTSGQGGQGYSSGGQGYNSGGYQQVAFHAQRASAYSRKGAPVAFERWVVSILQRNLLLLDLSQSFDKPWRRLGPKWINLYLSNIGCGC